jgi:DNA-binding MarR family transcriptional regulator
MGHLALDGDVNVKTVADHLHMSGAFITTVTSKLQVLGLVEKTQDSVDRRRISLVISEKGKFLLRSLAALSARNQRCRICVARQGRLLVPVENSGSPDRLRRRGCCATALQGLDQERQQGRLKADLRSLG